MRILHYISIYVNQKYVAKVVKTHPVMSECGGGHMWVYWVSWGKWGIRSVVVNAEIQSVTMNDWPVYIYMFC